MLKKMLQEIGKNYTLIENKTNEFGNMKVSGMNFTVKSYYAEGLGNVSIMEAKGFFGLMKMDTFVINPFEIDAPLYSYDRIHAMGNDTLISELYDTTLKHSFNEENIRAVVLESGNEFSYDPGEHWYDDIKSKNSVYRKGKKSATAKLDQLSIDFFNAYLNGVLSAEKCDKEAKKMAASAYSDGLLKNGGPSTDVFVKKFGLEKTKEFFDKVLFGVK